MTTTAEFVDVDQIVEHALAQTLDMAPGAVLVVIDCDTCGRYGEPITAAKATAQDCAGVHDDLHHRGQPTADLRIYQP